MSYPVCPGCGNICGKLARICADCGAFLFEPTVNDRIDRQQLIEAGLAALRREDTATTEGKVN